MEEYKENLLKLSASTWGQAFRDSLYWDKNLNFNVLCNDLFWWACADSEPIESQEDVDLLHSCFDDLEVPLDGTTENYENERLVDWLYACRRRKMRPQTAAFKYIPKEFWKFFKSAGPIRKKSFLNPYTFKAVQEYLNEQKKNDMVEK